MTEQQEKKAKEAFMRTSSGVPIEFYSLARVFFDRGFEAGLEAANEQPASICRGCGNYNDGMCDWKECGVELICVKTCPAFVPVSFDEKESHR